MASPMLLCTMSSESSYTSPSTRVVLDCREDLHLNATSNIFAGLFSVPTTLLCEMIAVAMISKMDVPLEVSTSKRESTFPLETSIACSALTYSRTSESNRRRTLNVPSFLPPVLILAGTDMVSPATQATGAPPVYPRSTSPTVVGAKLP